MKGILKNTDKGWVVRYFDIEKAHDIMYCGESLPLYQETFDIDKKQPIVPLVDHKEVEFEFKYHWEQGMEEWVKSAKLINVEYPELEGTIQSDDKTWDEIFVEVEDSLHFEMPIRVKNWLKNKFKSPVKK